MRIRPRTVLKWTTRPGGVATLVVCGALGLMLLPMPVTDALRSLASDALAPGERAARFVVSPLAAWVDARRAALVARHVDAETQATIAELRAENERLRGTLLHVAGAPTERAGAETALVSGALTPARVLDGHTRAALAGMARIDAGAQQRLSAGLLAVEGSGNDDQGSATALKVGAIDGCAAGQPVLAGSRVVGKLAHVDREMSWLLSPTDPKYRDEVVIHGAERSAATAEGHGILEGMGDGRCRVRMVSASQPVAVGDVVFPAGGEGLWETPPSYGQVISAERPPGATHWEIVVQPWGGRLSRVVSVVRAALRPPRLAAARSQPR